MNKPRTATLLLVSALVLATLAAVNFFVGRNTEREKRLWTEDQLAKMTVAKEVLEKEKDELTKAKEALEAQLSDAATQAQELADEIAQEKRAREALTTEVAQAKRESADLDRRLETERREKLALTAEVTKAKQSYQALSNELITLRQAKEALEKRVKEMLTAQASEAEKIIVKPTAEAGKAAPSAALLVEGKVLVVNREFNFVVVNVGSRSGLKVGTPLVILRGDKAVGRAQVERIYDNMAAASILTEEQKGKIQEGDAVRTSS